MASKFDLYQYARDASYGSIEELHGIDGLSWDQLSEWAGFEGPSSLRNIINNETHNLDFARGCMLLKKLSELKNLRVHKHTLDTTKWEIVPRYDDVAATGSLEKQIIEAVKAMAIADDALQASNTDVLEQQYRRLQRVCAKVRAELETAQSRMRNQED